jgi:hypothetical protein
MHILDLTLVVGGAGLAAMGTARLTHAALRTMPRSVAIAILVAGAVVVAFGATLARLAHPSPNEITLQPQSSADRAAPGPRTDFHGVVRSLDHLPVADANVVLTQAGSKTTIARTAPDGSFVFHGVAIGGPYRVAVTHGGGVFDKIVFLPSPPLEVAVAPTTTKPDEVHVRAASLAVVGDERGVQAVYALTLDNTGRTAYTGGVPLPVLPGAAALEPRSGLDRTQLGFQDGMLFSSAPVMPGATAITYTYVAPMPPKGLDLGIDVTFVTDRFDLLTGGRLRSTSARHNNGRVALGGRTYQRLTWRRLRTGQMVGARVAPHSAAGTVRIGAIATGGLVAAAIVVVPLIRRRRRTQVSPSPQAVPAQGWSEATPTDWVR